MIMQNFFRKLGGVIEILGHIANANEPTQEEKEAHNRLIDEMYDSSYYSGHISYSDCEASKQANKI